MTSKTENPACAIFNAGTSANGCSSTPVTKVTMTEMKSMRDMILRLLLYMENKAPLSKIIS